MAPDRRRPAALFLAGVISISGFLAACGDDAEPTAADTQTTIPTGGVALDDLPLYPRSEPFGPASETDGAVTRSYEAKGTSPEEVIKWYVDALEAEGWAETEPVNRADTEGRVDFLKGDDRLELSAIAVDDVGDEENRGSVVQYSLTLRPIGS